MALPAHDEVTGEVYDSLEPLAYADAAHGYALLHLCQAIGLNYQTPYEWAHDSPEEEPGFSLLLDVDRCPADALPWLAQFVGVSFVEGLLDEAGQRDQIRERPLWARGTLPAILDAVRETLTGTRTVAATERTGGNAYRLRITVETSETPDSDVTEAAALSLLPAGNVLTLVVVGEVTTYERVAAAYADYNELSTTFATYGDLRENTPI